MKALFDLCFKNFILKIASIFIAFLIWSLVQGEEILEYNQRIEVEIVTPENLMVSGPRSRFLEATLRGPRVILGRRQNEPLKATLRVQSTGEYEIPFEPSMLNSFDQRIRVTSNDPYIRFRVGKKEKKTVPVVPITSGMPKKGFFIKEVTVEPKKIEILGTSEDLRRIDEIKTQAVNIDGLDRSESFQSGFAVPSVLSEDSFVEKEATVLVTLEDNTVERTFKDLPLQVVGLPNRQVSLTPAFVDIRITAPPSILSSIFVADIQAFVNIQDAPAGKYEERIETKIRGVPADLVDIATEPEIVMIEILK